MLLQHIHAATAHTCCLTIGVLFQQQLPASSGEPVRDSDGVAKSNLCNNLNLTSSDDQLQLVNDADPGIINSLLDNAKAVGGKRRSLFALRALVADG